MSGRHIRRGDAQRAYAFAHPILLSIATVAAVTGPLIGLFPGISHDSALVQALPRWTELVWAVSYSGGGIAVLVGILRLNPRAEAAGCFMLSGAVGVNMIAIAIARGPSALVSGLTGATAIGFAIRGVILSRKYTGETREAKDGTAGYAK